VPRGLELHEHSPPLQSPLSVPSRTVFSLNGKAYFGSVPAGKKESIQRARHEKPVPTLESGLVDMDALSMYLHRNPLFVPLYATRGWEYHHVNHPKTVYKQESLPEEERDERLIWFRGSTYQQLHMRIGSEEMYHDVHEIYGTRPPMATIEMALRDFRRLDVVGASAIYLNLLNGNNQYNVDVGSFNPPWIEDVDIFQRREVMQEARADAERGVSSAEVLEPRLVTSALKRLALALKDPYINKLADRRLSTDPNFYPVRTPSHKTLLTIANGILFREFVESNSAGETLQTEVERVQLAA